MFTNLNKHFPKERHYVGGVERTQPANDADGQLSDLKHLIIQCNKQRRKVLRLRKVRVKLLVQRDKNAETNFRLYNTDRQTDIRLTASFPGQSG